jgi:hypothetical protein
MDSRFYGVRRELKAALLVTDRVGELRHNYVKYWCSRIMYCMPDGWFRVVVTDKIEEILFREYFEQYEGKMYVDKILDEILSLKEAEEPDTHHSFQCPNCGGALCVELAE